MAGIVDDALEQALALCRALNMPFVDELVGILGRLQDGIARFFDDVLEKLDEWAAILIKRRKEGQKRRKERGDDPEGVPGGKPGGGMDNRTKAAKLASQQAWTALKAATTGDLEDLDGLKKLLKRQDERILGEKNRLRHRRRPGCWRRQRHLGRPGLRWRHRREGQVPQGRRRLGCRAPRRRRRLQGAHVRRHQRRQHQQGQGRRTPRCLRGGMAGAVHRRRRKRAQGSRSPGRAPGRRSGCQASLPRARHRLRLQQARLRRGLHHQGGGRHRAERHQGVTGPACRGHRPGEARRREGSRGRPQAR